MTENKIINYAVAIFAITIFALAITPRLYAQETIGYELQIPCAIDRTQIIIPNPIDPEYSGPYKEKCNSNAYFNSGTNTYHFKKNEGYYLDLKLMPEETNKITNISEIESIVLDFYKEGNDSSCFTRKLTKSSTDSLFHGKIGYVKDNDSEEYAKENMTGFINSCGLDTTITFKALIKLNTGEEINTNNLGNIKYLIIDSDNSNLTAENARIKNQNQIHTNPNAQNSKPNTDIQITAEKPKEQFTTRPVIESESSGLFITKENTKKKVIPLTQILQENKIDSRKIIGEIILETESKNPEYVFGVKERKKLFGFIPFGKEKIVEKRISAIKEIKE